MAIYGDGKHNENMEYNTSKYVVTDKTVYRTTHWCVETENDTYFVQCQEGDLDMLGVCHDEIWYIESDEKGPIDKETELGHELITTCETYEDCDREGGYNG